MNPDPKPVILKAFPGTRYYPRQRLVTWHPRGVFDEDLANRVIEFIEHEELVAEAPFDRFADFNGITETRLKFTHVFAIAERRRTGYHGEPVKSALFCEGAVGYGMARMYEMLMDIAVIKVRSFRVRDEAADWLKVSVDILQPMNCPIDPAFKGVTE